MRLKNITESQEQMAVIEWMGLQLPWLVKHTIYIMNERKTSPQFGLMLKRMGRLSGASDLFVAWPTSKFFGAFIEMKTKKGRPTKEQIEFLERMSAVGYCCRVCYGADEAIDFIKGYLLNK